MLAAVPNPGPPPGAGGDAFAGAVAPDAVRQELTRLLASSLFPPNSRAAQFLAFVVDEKLNGREESIKETSVALQVFHRKPSFDPRIDSAVRVEAHHLRKRLRQYYSSEGVRDEVVIDLPVGSYVPRFQMRRPVEQPDPAARPGRWRRAVPALVVVSAALGAGWTGIRMAGHVRPQRSVAVLSFKNLGGLANEALCQGLAEDITAQLGRAPRLRVTSRSSASRFQPGAADVRQIGDTLSVRAVLEGSVRPAGDRIHFTARLIDTSTGFQKWSEAFEYGIADALAAEEEVARLIVKGVTTALEAGTTAGPATAYVPSAAARQLFWEARYLRQQSTAEARARAASLLERAVALDPRYVDAWAALANLLMFRTFHQEGDFSALARETRSAAETAIALDPGNTEGLLALAEMEWLQDHNWTAAERRLRRALDLNPSSASARGWLATGLVARGRFDDALRELERAAAINPLSYLVSNDRSTALYCARRWDRAVRSARDVLAVNPKFYYARVVIGACHAAQKRYSQAIREFQQAADEGGRGTVLGRLGNALALAGRRAEAESILQELERAPEGTHVHAAYVRIGLGDRAGALDSLEAALAGHETDLNYIAADPVFDPLRDEPRYLALRQELGL